MAARRTRQNAASDDLPSRTAGGVALFDGGYSEGVQEDLAAAFELVTPLKSSSKTVIPSEARALHLAGEQQIPRSARDDRKMEGRRWPKSQQLRARLLCSNQSDD